MSDRCAALMTRVRCELEEGHDGAHCSERLDPEATEPRVCPWCRNLPKFDRNREGWVRMGCSHRNDCPVHPWTKWALDDRDETAMQMWNALPAPADRPCSSDQAPDPCSCGEALHLRQMLGRALAAAETSNQAAIEAVKLAGTLRGRVAEMEKENDALANLLREVAKDPVRSRAEAAERERDEHRQDLTDARNQLEAMVGDMREAVERAGAAEREVGKLRAVLAGDETSLAWWRPHLSGVRREPEDDGVLIVDDLNRDGLIRFICAALRTLSEPPAPEGPRKENT